MSLVLSDGVTDVDLDPDLLWVDEFPWSRVEQTVTRTVSGALIVQQSMKVLETGRPITLQPEDDSTAWMPRAAVDQFQQWVDLPDLVLTLTGLRGVVRTVMFRQQEGAVVAVPVVHYSDVDAADNYRVTLRLMQV